jgi:branched-chain amino acid transport system substrate-binding protein
MIQALDGVVANYEKAIAAGKGQWPTTEQLADSMHGLDFRGLTRHIKIREDGQGLESQLLGVAKKTAAYPFPVLDKMVIYPGEMVTAPVGKKSPDWVKTLTPALLNDASIKAFPALK